MDFVFFFFGLRVLGLGRAYDNSRIRRTRMHTPTSKARMTRYLRCFQKVAESKRLPVALVFMITILTWNYKRNYGAIPARVLGAQVGECPAMVFFRCSSSFLWETRKYSDARHIWRRSAKNPMLRIAGTAESINDTPKAAKLNNLQDFQDMVFVSCFFIFFVSSGSREDRSQHVPNGPSTCESSVVRTQLAAKSPSYFSPSLVVYLQSFGIAGRNS